MNSARIKILIGFVVLIAFASCKEESLEPNPYYYEYFPVDLGRYVIYNVDSIYHADNDNNNDDSVYSWHFQIKEVIDSSFIDGQGRTANRVLRYRRNDTTQAWTFMNVWTQTRTNTAGYRFEDNIVYHKLSFPVNIENVWDGNDSNILDEEPYSYDALHVPMSYQSLHFDSTISVLQRDDDNFVERIYGYETYANHIGLVFKQRDNLRKNNGQVVFGTQYKMTVAGYGIE
jgi:hypothetical protein